MTKAIARVRDAYPQLPLLFSFDSQDLSKFRNNDLSYIDLLEYHIWMANQNGGEFNQKVGYAFDKFSPASYKNLVKNGEKLYREDPDYWNGLLTKQIRATAEICQTLGKPLATTECWGVIDYKDWPGLHWDWIKELCELGSTTAASTGQWVAIGTSNFCGPQFTGMWNDVVWHKRLTSIIRNAEIDQSILQNPNNKSLLERMK